MRPYPDPAAGQLAGRASRQAVVQALTQYESLGPTPLDRLRAFIALDPTGMRGAAAIRARQERVRQYLQRRDHPPEPERPKWQPRSARWTPAERCLRQARARGWLGLIRAVAYEAGVKGLSFHASTFPQWGERRSEEKSWESYSRSWHRANGPARWWQHRAAAVELTDRNMEVVGESSRGKRVYLTLTREWRGQPWRAKWEDITARPLDANENYWLIYGKDTLLAARDEVLVISRWDADAIVRAVTTTEVKALLEVSNAEARRVVADLVPTDRLAQAAKEISRDDYGVLLDLGGVRICRVVCPSTGRVYLLRVPPSCETAHEAVAWTFGLKVEEYHPEVQA